MTIEGYELLRRTSPNCFFDFQALSRVSCSWLDDVTLFAEMADYLPGFKRLMDMCTRDEMDGLSASFPGFYRYGKILERIAEGIHSGAIVVPK